ncbi:Uma2 family endonuclease [Lyngbya sp. CCAP 1446/10]|uniref:Uma2 family endonuclease n=1 Tax=Lyngbya sp. CCAP 1446/10 TaxID=439293 RepID=UPI0022388A52|nr:Uma2 family endonuclease [Lyngbya sp. CCAP 1446/10]MCW6053125.1 Uma2 family endonuclease [Lyngbya sp. CCAP 1446/10]
MNPQLLDKPVSESNQCLTLYDVSWEKLEAIEAALDDFQNVRLAYLYGTLDIMSPLSVEHEDGKTVIRRLLEVYFEYKGIRFYTRGSKTLGSIQLGARKEPDESFNLETKKEVPDIVIEVVVTSGGVNTLEIYRKIKVPEVWFWKKGKLALYHLQDEEYKQVERSELLPELDLKLFVRCANIPDQYDAVVEFRNQLREGQEEA